MVLSVLVALAESAYADGLVFGHFRGGPHGELVAAAVTADDALAVALVDLGDDEVAIEFG